METKWEILFALGDLRVTAGARQAIDEAAQEPIEFYMRHVTGDRGNVTAEEKEANRRALKGGRKIASAYDTAEDVRICVIIEPDHWANPSGPAEEVGAVTWCDGASGYTGQVTAVNSLVGGTAFDTIGGTS